MAEISDLTVDGRTGRTIAIESEDPAAVCAAIRSVGLGGYLNTSYPRGLARLLDGPPPRYGVIDVGANSVKSHLAELRADGAWQTLIDRAEITRLGEGIRERGVTAPEALERTIGAIAGMVEEARGAGAVALAVVGTAGLRAARDGADAAAAIEARTGVTVEIIPGEEEARLAFLAVQAGLGLTRGAMAVFDTGGGSTQLTFGRDGRVEERFSVDVGAVRYTERFGLDGVVGAKVVEEALATISADLSRLDGRPAPDALVGMGGAVTNLAAVSLALAEYDPDRIQGSVLERAEVNRQIELYGGLEAEARRSIAGLQPKRAEVILAGACIVRTVMDELGQGRLTVSDRGLRHGVLLETSGVEHPRRRQGLSPLERPTGRPRPGVVDAAASRAGRRPASRSARRRRNSICPLTERRSSDAQAARAPMVSGSSRSRKAFRSAMSVSAGARGRPVRDPVAYA